MTSTLELSTHKAKLFLIMAEYQVSGHFSFTPIEQATLQLLDNEFSVFSSKEVDVFSYSYPNSLFEFAGYSINFWVIIFVALAFVVVLMAFVVWLIRRKRKERNVEANKHLGA